MSEIINGANMNRSGAYPGWQAMSAIDEAAAAAKTEVTVTQVQTSTNGTKIATIGVDDVNTDIYTPAVSVTQVQGSTDATKIATVGVGATSTDIYAPAVSVTQVQGSTGATKIATVGVGATSTDIYAPAGGGDAGSATGIPVPAPIAMTVNLEIDENTYEATVDKTYAELAAAIDAVSGDANYVAVRLTGSAMHRGFYYAWHRSMLNSVYLYKLGLTALTHAVPYFDNSYHVTGYIAEQYAFHIKSDNTVEIETFNLFIPLAQE